MQSSARLLGLTRVPQDHPDGRARYRSPLPPLVDLKARRLQKTTSRQNCRYVAVRGRSHTSHGAFDTPPSLSAVCGNAFEANQMAGERSRRERRAVKPRSKTGHA
jgi:hypothetical protein